jgi:hypothetical protein
MTVGLTREQVFLRKLVGCWEGVADATSSNPERAVWRENIHSVYDAWYVGEGHGAMPGGGSATTLLIVGFDRDRGKFVGSWVDTMMNHVWVYEGALDETGRTLVLETSGPDVAAPERTARYRERIAFEDGDNRIFSSEIEGEDGGWKTLMTMRYYRCP